MLNLLRTAPASANPSDTAHSFSFAGIGGEAIDLADFAGRPILVVNTASRCGFTNQYEGMQRLWDRYRDRGLVVLGVPSNDFRQELATNGAVAEFCETTFGIDFPMTGITAVTGGTAHPFYRWAADQVGPLGQVRWNFHKFLIDGEGRLAEWFSTMTAPDSRKVAQAVEATLTAAGR